MYPILDTRVGIKRVEEPLKVENEANIATFLIGSVSRELFMKHFHHFYQYST